MWISEQSRKRTQTESPAQTGRVTLPGDPAGVYLDGERRDLPVYGPGGYVWRPAQGREVLVLKTGAAGEAPCVAGERCGSDWTLEAGGVLIYSGAASIRLSPGGDIQLTGTVRINGKQVLTEEE